MHQNDELGRGRLTLSKRVDLLERDRAQQSRVLTEIVDKVGKGFTDEQMAQIRAAMREELADAGLRLDDADHQDEAREDFRFLRRLRMGFDKASAKVGGALLMAGFGLLLVIFGIGFWQWVRSHLP